MRTGATVPDAPPPGAKTAPARRWGDLWPRVLSGLVMVALALSTAIAGGWLFIAFWLVASLAVLWEWQRLLGAPRLVSRLAIGGAAILGASLAVAVGQGVVAAALALAGLLGLAVAARPGERVLAPGGLAYAGALAAATIVLRLSATDGLAAILWLFAVVWGTDIMAYFGGRLLGGPKLWPRLSPSKTWSGFLVGISCGALAGLAIAPVRSLSILLLGALAGALAQGGDLFESRLKRRFGVKDSSGLIPGHGGVMDRLDGFIAAAAGAACLGVARAGLDAAGQGLFSWP